MPRLEKEGPAEIIEHHRRGSVSRVVITPTNIRQTSSLSLSRYRDGELSVTIDTEFGGTHSVSLSSVGILEQAIKKVKFIEKRRKN